MKAFNLVEDPEKWTITWDGDKEDIRKAVYKEKLLFTVFQHTNADRVGFWLRLNGGEHDMLWVDRALAYIDSNRYGEYIQDMYIIDGVGFIEEDDAVNFYDWLEKQYIWQTLKD